jgi:hypothetical protein
VGAWGTPLTPVSQDFCGLGPHLIDGVNSNPGYVIPSHGLWTGDDMYRLVRMLITRELQALTMEFMDAFHGRSDFGADNRDANELNYKNTLNTLNSGLSLESAILFNLPQLNPGSYNRRAVRVNQSNCDMASTPDLATLDYLEDFEENSEDYIQGALEQEVNLLNGVADIHRGKRDQVAIAIRRGRETGVPSFLSLRALVSNDETLCTPTSWTDLACPPASIFRAEAIPSLQSLYVKPIDVELAVGVWLSADRFDEFNLMLDKTQTYLILGEIDRIIVRDAFSFGITVSNTLFDRFGWDDPRTGVTATFRDNVLLKVTKERKIAGLIQDNSGVDCVPIASFSLGGYRTIDTHLGADGRNVYKLPGPNNKRGQQNNCDAPLEFFQNFDANHSPNAYKALYCGSTPCIYPALPFCL